VDKINYNTLKVGMILKVNPCFASHEKKPYYIEVIKSTSQGFTTVIAPQSKGKTIMDHQHTFNYFDNSWDYHKGRFEITGKFISIFK